ncbi:MAG: hypothetical protein QGF59_19510, partial [Pirellulaceae bacterium]|nr:hypothetical protein [Pirellulaceae bacterium]
MLGADNDAKSDILYGGTGLDFLYGNGGGNDVIITRHGSQFGAGDSDLAEDEAWKEYAKSTDKVWYLAGSGGDDEITVDYVTNPYNPLYGRHLVTFSTAGSFDPRFNGFDSFTAFDTNNDAIHDTVDNVLDLENLLVDRETGLPRIGQAAVLEQFANMGVTATDIVGQVFGLETDFAAIIIDALDGSDNVTVGETVQKTVWVDAGPGDDLVRIEPQLAFLPDATDPFGDRNDVIGDVSDHSNAYDFGVVDSSRTYAGLTIDSARAEEPDIDWYRFQLGVDTFLGDIIAVRPTSGLANVALECRLYEIVDDTLTDMGLYDPLNGPIDISTLQQATDYWLSVKSEGSIPTEYEIALALAATHDEAESNDSAASAALIQHIHNVSRIVGLTLDQTSDVDWFKFSLQSGGVTDGEIALELSADDYVTMELFANSATELLDTSTTHTVDTAGKEALVLLSSLPEGDYWLRVSVDTARAGHQPVRYELNPEVGQAAL